MQLGSSLEYGKLKSPHKENNICRPQSIYGNAKYLATKYLLKNYKKNKFPAIILRLYQSYGPKQDVNRFIPIIIKSCLKDKNFHVQKENNLGILFILMMSLTQF